MFPFCFEWSWDAGHLVFMGLVYLVLGVIACGLVYAVVNTWRELRSPEAQDSKGAVDGSRR